MVNIHVMRCNNIIPVLTHHHGHTLDVLSSRDTSTLLTDIEVKDINLCNDDGVLIRNHYSIECTIQQSTQLQNREIVSYRNVKQIDIDQFCKDVSESPTLNNIRGTVNELVDRYNLGMRVPESILFLYPLTFPQPSILLITKFS